jgi:hypothetical protein
MLHAAIQSVEPQPNGVLRVTAVAPLGDADRSDLRRTIDAYESDDGTADGPLREMDLPVAAGSVTSLFADDRELRVAALVVDESSIRKVKNGVLKFLRVGGRFVSLVDRVSTDPALDLVKGAFLRTFEENAMSTFGETFMKSFREALETEDDGRANQGDPVRLTSENSTDPATTRRDSSGLASEPAFDALHDGKRSPVLDIREVFDRGPGFRSLWDLRQETPPPQDIWRSLISAENPMRDAMLRPGLKPGEKPDDTYPMLRPNGSAPSPSAAMRKAASAASAATAAAYSGPDYKFLRPNL